ncbi:MAG: L,D-transpeptidase [Pseudolabrys sp.]|nr:L,D-transpeptidase [Pseudolabrys sp.]
MASVVIKRTALFVAFLLVWVLLTAAIAHASTRDHDIVAFSGFSPGTIVVKTSERRLYFVIDHRRAVRFPVGVGRKGKTWTGRARIEGKFVKPSWAPPDDIRREQPNLPKVIAGGADNNPMGAAALTMLGGDYAIHGTNRPESIGGFVSYGCIRMHNRDIRTLYRMVDIGTPVIVER